MKTLWIINEYAGSRYHGMVYRHYYLARELIKLGVKVYIISSSFSHTFHTQPATRGIYTFEVIDGINYVWVKVPKYEGAHSKKRAWKWIVFMARLFLLPSTLDRPDAIMVSPTAPFPILPAYFFKYKFRARLLFEVRDIWPLSIVELGGFSRRNPLIRLMQWLEEFAYQKSDRVVSVLPNALDHMKLHGLNIEKYVYIPNGFSLEEMRESLPLEDNIEKQFPKGKFIVGYAGTVGHANSLENLILAAEALKAYKDISFVVIGDGKDRKRLLGIKESKSLDNLTFIDYVPKNRILNAIRRFDVCYIGLKNKAIFHFGVSPNKLYDYLYSAKPIIYAIDSGNDPINQLKCIIRVGPDDINAIVDAVVHLYRLSAEDRFLYGQIGKRYVLEHHEYRILASKLYDELG